MMSRLCPWALTVVGLLEPSLLKMLRRDLGQAEESRPFERVILLLELEKPRHFVVIKNGDQPSPVEWKVFAL
ncbi:unnamed protein product [Gulo gulo]|uniref:Uncharacterized protein n=1 Tax=Gulo gulo TaxID=48420 RepID=A0A9X9LQI4_GULGU|nr:unnamed protein product [Gulo gulo]